MTVSLLILLICFVCAFGFHLNDIQIKSTHNSYHVRPTYPPPDWDYSYQPVNFQLDAGVRHFQYTVRFQNGTFPVYALRVYDEETNCLTLLDCFNTLRSWWSGTGRNTANKIGNPLLFINVEVKENWTENEFQIFDQLLLSAWGESTLLTPDSVRGNYSTLNEAITQGGWPNLPDVAGKVMIMFEEAYPAYMTGNYSNLAGRLAFPSYTFATRNQSNAAVLRIVTPDNETLPTAVHEGYFVRAYADNNMPYFLPQTQDEIDRSYFFVIDTDHGLNVTKQECVDFITALSPGTDPSITEYFISEIFVNCHPGYDTLSLGDEWTCAARMSNIVPAPSAYMNISQATSDATLAVNGGAHIVVTNWYAEGPAAGQEGYWLQLGSSQYPVSCNPITTAVGIGPTCTLEVINAEFGTAPFPDEEHNHGSQIIAITVASVVVAVVILLVLGYLMYSRYGTNKKEENPTPSGNYPFLKIND